MTHFDTTTARPRAVSHCFCEHADHFNYGHDSHAFGINVKYVVRAETGKLICQACDTAGHGLGTASRGGAA